MAAQSPIASRTLRLCHTLFSLLLTELLRPTFRTLAVFPNESEATRYAREKLAEGNSRLSVCPDKQGWAVRLIGGGV